MRREGGMKARTLLLLAAAAIVSVLLIFNTRFMRLTDPGTRCANGQLFCRPVHLLPQEPLHKGHQVAKVEPKTCQLLKLQFAASSEKISILCPNEDNFRPAARVFNSRFSDILPHVVVQPRTDKHIVAALKMAKKEGLMVTVRDGGHNPAGITVHPGAMLIDMSLMNQISVDYDRMTFTTGGGTLWTEVQDKIMHKNVSVVGGGCPTVGTVGLALGGGLSWLSRSKGLVSDNVLQMKVIMPNGSIAMASESTNTELFWGLRGAGGSNFGVVSEATFKLFHAEEMYFAGSPCFPNVTDAAMLQQLLELWSDAVVELQDPRVTLWLVTSNGHRNKPSSPALRVCIALFFDGPVREGAAASQPILSRLGQFADEHPDLMCASFPKICGMAKNPSTRGNVQSVGDWFREGQPYLQGHTFISWSRSMGANKAHIYWKSGFIQEISPVMAKTAADVLFDFDDKNVHPNTTKGLHYQFQIEHLGGAIADKPANHSSYAYRSARILWAIQAYTVYLPTAEQDRLMERWSAEAMAELEPFFSGSYANYADDKLDGWEHKYYGREHYTRLQKLKEAVGGFELFSTRQRVQQAPI
ncbi:unnamed protein product [Ostreobium quekettii]|uniref:FAD-binding PCMH-type domain-containing protein n=1 Tax=Ostreobium quekettii TaxID=121088 RepID=A0A8S1IL60_9CHLO|nr:unnamed protein product [Ostreobium quekettii]